MEIDFREIDPKLRYKLLISTVIPRPIALVSTRGSEGTDNIAPFSFFNVFGEDPPLVVLGLQAKEPGSLKDTTRNIHITNEFVIHLVDTPMAEAMNNCAVDFPKNISEFDIVGLTRAECRHVNVKRIKEAPVALECRRTIMLQLNETRDLCIGEVIYMHIKKGIIDPNTMRINLDEYDVVARLFGDLYASLGKPYPLKRLTHKEWLTKQEIN
ncbi:MAG: nitrilotriacetate monooxygenase [Magnetovibrio sp.]|nr:nitrilotriacetate monooxygenase [Magnetovibrio sp.]